MKQIFIITLLLTLSSCMVSQKTFDEKCCKMEAQIQELESKANGIELKEQLLRQTIFDLQNSVDSLKVKNDTIRYDYQNGFCSYKSQC